MKAVGVRTLKAKLSEYLRLVRSGEVVLVTDREEVIAELRPSRRQDLPLSALDQGLDRLAEAGKVTLRSDESVVWDLDPPPVDLTGISSQEILRVTREDSK